jgi:precorrin-3B C17-methyltransferase
LNPLKYIEIEKEWKIMNGKLLIIGFGPGSFEHITKRAREAIQESEVVIGYNTYVDLIAELLTNQKIVRTGMTEEVSRAQEAVRQAELGKIVAVISSGDAGVYGMAGLVYEVLIGKGWSRSEGVEVEVIPGISAINSTASLLGAPIMHDSCTISLSDHLTPWEQIAKRVDAAGQADFVIALYNPRSGRRTRQIVESQQILLKYRSPDTPVGIVKSAYRDREHVVITTLEKMLDHDIGMLTTVIIGNSTTMNYEGLMITPRGYQRKYTLDTEVQRLRPHQRLQSAAEPWALEQWDEEAESDEVGSRDELFEKADEGIAGRLWTADALAQEALNLLNLSNGHADLQTSSVSCSLPYKQEAIFEFAVSPGLANKKFTAKQMAVLADVVGEQGEIEYTPHHQLIVRVSVANPDLITSRLTEEGFLLQPIGDVVQLKACDFCNLEKVDSLPYAEELNEIIGGIKVPKELRIGFNGCGMTCYNAVSEDIGIVYRQGNFDLFLGGKTVGRNAHAAQPVAEGIKPEDVVGILERIINRYIQEGHPNERFHKFFRRVQSLEGYRFQDVPSFVIENALCGE